MPRARILIADKLPPAAITRLQAADFAVHADPDLKETSLAAALTEHQPDVLIIRSTKVRAAHFEAGTGLQLVVRAGAGVNNVDLEAASARGVYVSNCPGMNAVAVAELAMGHILNADRRIADGVAALREGQWAKKVFAKGAAGLKGRTLGVIGAGAIGKAVIARAKAFEMNIAVWSLGWTDARAAALGVTNCATPVELARVSDVVTVHLALTPATRGMIGEGVFEAMRPGAIFVNTSRGPVVDEAALVKAVQTKGIRAGLDVFCDEPSVTGPWQSPVVGLDGVYGTHHIGASTDQAQDAVADEACRIIEMWASEGRAPNCVNLAAETPASHLLVVRHEDCVGVLATVLGVLREEAMNVQGMENEIFTGDAGAACARIQIEGEPSKVLVSTLSALPHVHAVTMVEL